MLKENEAISVAAKILHEIISLLHKNDPLFEAYERAYRKATETLRADLSSSSDEKINTYLHAFESDIISSIIYAGYIGFQLNLKNFHSPIGVDLIHCDAVDTVKGHLFGHFPINYKNKRTKMDFKRSLTDNLCACHDAVTMYFNILECAAPKLACYWATSLPTKSYPGLNPAIKSIVFKRMHFVQKSEITLDSPYRIRLKCRFWTVQDEKANFAYLPSAGILRPQCLTNGK